MQEFIFGLVVAFGLAAVVLTEQLGSVAAGFFDTLFRGGFAILTLAVGGGLIALMVVLLRGASIFTI